MSGASVSSMIASSGSASSAKPSPWRPLHIILLTDRAGIAERLAAMLDPAWATVETAPGGQLPESIEADAVLVDVPAEDVQAMERALGAAARLRDTAVPVLIVDGLLPRQKRIALYRAGVTAFLSLNEDAEELAARLGSLSAATRTAARALGRLREYTRHLDEQLRLAQRLQRDFLPQRLPELAGARFAARLEPAAWVAGDFYDVFRLDEEHVGFYVADAVGHGIPAALLTVFVKKSLQTKRIEGKQYELISPGEALALLNADLLSAQLRETPFITIFYGIYNEVNRELLYARGGHPRPLVVGTKGALEPLDGEGPLLGIFGDAAFDVCRRRLEPGERLVVYSDGAERVAPGRQADPAGLFEIIRVSALLPVEALLDSVLDAVRAATGGDHLADDVSLVALEVDPNARA